jgi:hypothetical protein
MESDIKRALVMYAGDKMISASIVPEHVGIDYAKSGKDSTALIGHELGKAGKTAIIVGEVGPYSSSLKSLAKEQEANIDIVPIDSVNQLLDQYVIPIENRYMDLPDLSDSIYRVEKKKKKPCTSHEYVKKGEDKTVMGGGTIVKEIWVCRHCDHPLA